jgi:hypothetical protein
MITSSIGIDNHRALIECLDKLLNIVQRMQTQSSDALLAWLKGEVESWLKYAANHQEEDDLRSLKSEIVSRFHDKYNVRIEPKDLDEQRLSAFESLISCLDVIR